MFYDMDDISKLKSKEDNIIRWIKSMPFSRKEKIKTVYYENKKDKIYDYLSELLPCVKYIVGNSTFNEIDNYIQEYDLIILNDIDKNFNKRKFFELVKKLSKDGKIWIFLDHSFKINEIIEDINKEFNLNIKEKLNTILNLEKLLDLLNVKFFNTKMNYLFQLDNKCIDDLLKSQLISFEKKCKIKNYIKISYLRFIKLPFSIYVIG
jgi:hypothetical protein